MSVRFDGITANYLSRTASVPDYNSPYTVTGWFRPKTDNGATQATFSISPVSANNCFDFAGLAAVSDVSIISSRLDNDNIESTGGSTVVYDRWYFWAVVRNSTTDIRLYTDLIEDAQATINITGRTAADICSFGRLSVSGDGFVPLDAEMAFCRIWTTNLTLAEITAERLSRRAVKTASLFGDYPMLDAATAGNDVSGNGNDFTVNGTIATGASEPPLITGPSLFRGRTFSFFDDEEVNRFEFWLAVTTGATLERSASIAAVAEIAVSATSFTVHERSASLSAVTAVITAGQRDIQRAVSLDASASITVSAQVFSISERAVLLDATVTITTTSQSFTPHERATAINTTATISTSGVRVVERTVSLSATAAVETSAQSFSVLEASASLAAAVAVDVSAQSFTLLERDVLLSVVVDITTSAQSFSVLERVVSIGSVAEVATSSLRELQRAVDISAAATIETAAQRDLVRTVTVSTAVDIVVSGEVVPAGATVHERAASLTTTADIAVTATAFSVQERSASIGVTAIITSATQRDLHRAVSVTTTVTVTVTGQIAGGSTVHERSVSISASVSIRAGRLHVLAPLGQSYVVESPQRTLAVPSSNRIHVVPLAQRQQELA